MKFQVFLLTATCVCAQEQVRQSSTYTYDVHGRRVLSGSHSASGPSRTETIQSINGRNVPLESVQERVISEGPEGKLIERIVKKFDSSGNLSATEKVMVEEKKHSDGSTTTGITTYDSDLNGRFALRERSTTVNRRDSDTVHAETKTERPTLNGSLELQERRVAVTTGTEKDSRTDVTIYRSTGGLSLVEAARETTEIKIETGQTTTAVAQYNTGSTGKMELAGQRVSRLTKEPDGSELEVVDVYGSVATGRAGGSSLTLPKLREQQIIERRPGPDQSMTETFSVRRTELDSEKLTPVQKISETICIGNCKN